jgi:hypothetical protein
MQHDFVYSADNIIKYWRTKDKDVKLNNILECKKFNKDRTCTRNALTKYNFNTRNQKCFSCALLSSFTNKDCITNEIEILAGENRGDYLVTEINFSVDNGYHLLEFDYINKLFDTSDSNIQYYYVTKDENLNYACVNILIQKIMKDKNFNFYTNFLTYYICGQKIINIRFKYDFEDINELAQSDFFASSNYQNENFLKKDITRDILICLIIFYKFFSFDAFCHNEPCIKFLKFNTGFNNFVFEKQEFYIPFLFTIEMSKYSAINYKNGRYFNQDITNKKEWKSVPIECLDVDINGTKNYKKVDFGIPYNSEHNNHRILFYKIGNRSRDFIYARRKIGLALFYHSFDLICFIISLLLENCFSFYFFTDYKLINLWKGLWKRDEYMKINTEISDIRQQRLKKNSKIENNFETVFQIVKKYYIRIDALEYLYQNLIIK